MPDVMMKVEFGETALEYIYRFRPFSKERIGEASKTEIRRWFDQGSIQINGQRMGMDDPVFPVDVSSLILFPNGKRVTLL